ncbi:hypothetical protein GNI_142020 [Gregarina niphandrodes]|uniref:Uncharacterized protein n=1 Tax=Gregarina niphandrodes TaxID=110365 RepID=A0A023B069_GRENI|nr:hypothetical protein GNI_142020 [Gregarina niphandrodes]EZG44982.1 hypothetical protein GNI_142020 [Gregarina niphandrodes]|eukprot:XP_011132608.1 hypothetical protein GNI_142020 [Gregarina niphandrodes]
MSLRRCLVPGGEGEDRYSSSYTSSKSSSASSMPSNAVHVRQREDRPFVGTNPGAASAYNPGTAYNPGAAYNPPAGSYNPGGSAYNPGAYNPGSYNPGTGGYTSAVPPYAGGDQYTTSSGSSSSYSSSEAQLDTANILEEYEQKALDKVSAPPNASLLYEPKRPFTPFVSVGPIIGMVSETIARVLIETSADVEVKCFLTDAHGVQHGVSQVCEKNTPAVFVFEELRAGTKYRVSFNIPVPGVVSSALTTLPPNWGSATAPARIAAVSNHDLRAIAGTAAGSGKDVWRTLYKDHKAGTAKAGKGGCCTRPRGTVEDGVGSTQGSVSGSAYNAMGAGSSRGNDGYGAANSTTLGDSVAGKFDYLLLLGNLVYVDSSDYVETKEGRLPTEENDAAFLDGLELVEDLSPSQFGDVEDKVLEMFRNVYRDTLTHPTLRHVLANVPCLSLPGDMELGLCMDDDADKPRNFVHACAYKVYNEYFRALFEEVGDGQGGEIMIGQAYHFHAFGDVGFMLLDCKAQPLFHRSSKHVHETPFLGYRQWADIDYALSESGYLSLCRTIVVASVTPIVLAPESVWLTGSVERQMELLATWACADGVDEASLLLSKLNDWKHRKDSREVVLMCGNPVNGGVTIITDSRYAGNRGTLKQITAGPIAVKQHKGVSKLQGSLTNNAVGVYHKFHHSQLCNKNSYGTLQLVIDKDLGTQVTARVVAA